MKEQILKLRKEGKNYDEIVNIIGCSKSTVSYHCGKGQKEKSLNRQRKSRKTAKGVFRKKFSVFLRYKVKNFRRGSYGLENNSNFEYSTAYKQISENPVCYLTGRKINLEDSSSYELDHIIPFSKGGKNTLSNMGLTCKDANQCKRDLLLEDFISLCKEIYEHNK